MVGHIDNVFEKAHGCVLIGMHVECSVIHHLVQAPVRAGIILGVFTLDCPGLGFEIVFGIMQILEPVRLHLEAAEFEEVAHLVAVCR